MSPTVVAIVLADLGLALIAYVVWSIRTSPKVTAEDMKPCKRCGEPRAACECPKGGAP